MEFTPIGYSKGEKPAAAHSNLSPRKLDLNNTSRNDTRDEDDLGPMRKQRRFSNNTNLNGRDNTSTRLFNDASQFDDTIPELQNNNYNNNNAKIKDIQNTNILLPELNSNTDSNDIISNNNISNPIKQQQKRIESLVRTVAMLKLKNDVLINILKQDDPNKLDTNLKLIDDLSREKDKNNILNKDNNSLQLEINNLKDQLINTTKDNSAIEDINNNTKLHENCEREQTILKEQLEQNKIKINELNDQINSLNQKLNDTKLNNDNNNLTNKQLNDENLSKLETKVKDLSNLETKHLQEIKSLNSKLKQSQDEFDIKEKTFNNQLKDLRKEKTILKDKLQSEISQYRTKIDSLTQEINNFQNNITNQDDLINKQNHTKTQLIKCQKDLDAKIREFDDLQAILNNNKKLVSELETKNSTLSQEIDDLTFKFKNELKEKKIQIDTLNVELENYQTRHEKDLQRQDEYTHEINSLKEKIIQLEDAITIHKNEVNNLNSKDNDVQSENNELRQEISRLEDNIRQMQDNIEFLKNEIFNNDNELDNVKGNVTKRDEKIIALQKQLDDLENQLSTKTTVVAEKERELTRLTRQSNQFDEERNHLNDELRIKSDMLAKSNERIKSLENQLFQVTIKTSDETLNIINTKNNEIQSLKDDLKRITNELDKTLKTNNLIENKLSKKHQAKIKDLQDEIKLLNGMLGSKNEEYETSIRKLADEIDDWRQRYNSLNDTLQKQLEEAQSSTTSSQRERQSNEIDQLMKNRSDLLNHIDKLENNLRLLQKDNESLKSENSKIKESHSKLSDGMENLLNKYRERKNEFNAKLMDLENDNIRLERLVEKEKLKNLTRPNESSLSNIDSNPVAQDTIEYYRLKYHHEIIHNNDLKVKNEYLKNVLNAMMEQIEKDSRRIKRELTITSPSSPRFNTLTNTYRNNEFNRYDRPYSPSGVPYNDMPARYLTSEARIALRHKFRIRAIVVLSCLKMKQIAESRNQYDRKLEYLERRIRNQRDMNSDDRYSW